MATSGDAQKTPPELALITDFLQQCLPFGELTASEMATLARQLEISYRPQRQAFTLPDANGGLRIIRSGAVEMHDQRGQLIDRLGEGGCFHLEELLERHPGLCAAPMEDCLLYLLPQRDYLALRASHAGVDSFFQKQHDQHPLPQLFDGTAMMRQLDALASRDLLTAAPSDSIISVACAMRERRVSSVLILDDGELCGILTDRDLRSRVVCESVPGSDPVSTVMTASPHTIAASATVFDATLAMTQHSCHHLPVMDGAALMGIVTSSDLLLTRQDDPVYLVRRLSREREVGSLCNILQTLPAMLRQWSETGAKAGQLGHILTAVSNALTTRLIDLYIDRAGPAPVPFCWLGFGSQARSEQLIGADQDNGLLIADTLQPAQEAWFEGLADAVCGGLDQCGYPYCPGDVMATNPQWRQTLSGWQKTVDRWTLSPSPQAVMRCSIFFDLRAIYGEASMADELQRHMGRRASENSIFLAALAANALSATAPLGIFRRFLVERNGEHKDAIDLKKRGIIPIVDMVRIHALAHGIAEVNTVERLAALAQRKVLTPTECRNLTDAFAFILQLRMKTQASAIGRGEDVSNHCQVHELPRLAREQLRDAFGIVHDAQAGVRQRYRAGLG